MTWNDDNPNDSTYLASAIHTQMHSDKEMIRERLEAYNGTFNEHEDFDSEDCGVHPESEVAFVRISTAENRLGSPKEGTLHYFTVAGDGYSVGLYVVDDSLSYIKVNSLSHNDYTLDDSENPHSQYVYKDDDVTMGGDLTVESLTISGTQVYDNDSDPIASSHASEPWHTAHGEECLSNAKFADDSIKLENIRKASGSYIGAFLYFNYMYRSNDLLCTEYAALTPMSRLSNVGTSGEPIIYRIINTDEPVIFQSIILSEDFDSNPNDWYFYDCMLDREVAE